MTLRYKVIGLLLLKRHEKFDRLKYANAVMSNIRYYSEDSNIRSAFLQKFDSPLVVQNESKQKLKKGQVRIGVHCCAVNSSDLLLCQGNSEIKPNLPFVPGFEISGEVLEECKSEEDGNDSDDEDVIKVGDKVLALNKDNFHGFSEECVADVKDVFHIPTSLSYKTAAVVADSYSTAWIGLVRRAQLKEKNTVLITAAAGGLGLAAVDIAANVCKAKVIGVCGTEDKASLVRDKGAWAALTYTTAKSLKEKVMQVSNGQGSDIVFDAVGGQLFEDTLKCVRLEGKVVVAGFASRNITKLSMSELLQLPSFNLTGVSLSNYRNNAPHIYRKIVNEMIELCEQGTISPHISEVCTLDNVNEALNHLQERKTTGKVVLEIVT